MIIIVIFMQRQWIVNMDKFGFNPEVNEMLQSLSHEDILNIICCSYETQVATGVLFVPKPFF